ncbi:Uncharacterized protein Rs2_43276 [Raphanus sativus]|nr:Uncharacterized protein Rs2_43276 [Raphanus sativus]
MDQFTITEDKANKEEAYVIQVGPRGDDNIWSILPCKEMIKFGSSPTATSFKPTPHQRHCLAYAFLGPSIESLYCFVSRPLEGHNCIGDLPLATKPKSLRVCEKQPPSKS